jgi:lipopolysaccharide/colanic/teichoic acid biosynthesis glycosyltransferase
MKKTLDLALKRLFDILAAALGLLLLAPLFALVAWLIKRDSPGPAFYRGPRLGQGGKEFGILKFRTMYERPQSYAGPRITGKGDSRVTPIGRWLRDSKINELPQLWNVLKGEMSLVGPRPEDPEIAKSWPDAVRQEILAVRPGITSPASVLYRNEEALLASGPLMDTYLNAVVPTKQRLDQLYVRRRSFLLDLDTILWTFMVLVPSGKHYDPPEDLLFLGPFARLIRRYVSWFTVDFLVSLLALGAMGVLWRLQEPLNVGWWRSFGLAYGFALLFSMVGAVMGTQRISWSKARVADALDLALPVLLAALAAQGFNAVLGERAFPPLMLWMASAFSAVGFVVVRYRSRLLNALAERLLGGQRARLAQERVLVVGSGDAGQLAVWMLQNGSYAWLFQVVGFVDDDLYKQDTRIRGVDVLGRRQDIPRLVAQHDVGVMLFAIHNIAPHERKNLLAICAETPAHVVEMPNLLGELQAAMANGKDGRAVMPNGRGPYVPAAQVQAMLNEMETLANAGDLPALQQRLCEWQGGIAREP